MAEFKSGFVTLIGRTNVGKSTLINLLVGEKVAAIANKVQTTRTAIRGIVNRENSQIVFIDTPGIHKPKTKLNETMVETSFASIPDADVVLFLIEATSDEIGRGDRIILDEIEKHLKVGPAYYDIEEYTDQTMRQLAEETIREKALKLLDQEVPHGIYVEVEKMQSRKNKQNEDIYDIEATIYCLRNSHKGIIIGKNGDMLKRIGRSARIDMERNFGVKVNLKTWVKVKEDWQENDSIVNKFKLK